MERIRFYLSRDQVFGDSIAVRITANTKDGFAVPVAEMAFRIREKSEEGTTVPPLFSMTFDSAQQLMDELWNLGIKPGEGTGSAGALAATQRHLEDLPSLVFKKDAP